MKRLGIVYFVLILRITRSLKENFAYGTKFETKKFGLGTKFNCEIEKVVGTFVAIRKASNEKIIE